MNPVASSLVQAPASPTRPRVVLDWMTPADDDGIRALLRGQATGGDLHLALTREPSLTDALRVEGETQNVLVARDGMSGRVVGIGARSVKPGYVNGRCRILGYLSGLRVAPGYRNGRDFFRAYRLMHEAHRRAPAALTFTTILEGNDRARRLLTSGRMRLPAYRELGPVHVLCFAPGRRRRQDPPAGVRLRWATSADREAVLAFLHTHGPRRQGFPAYRDRDWGTPGGLLRDLAWSDMVLAEKNGSLVGCLGVWNQLAFRQSRILGYSRRYQVVRPLWNLVAPRCGRPSLPAPGSILNHRCLAVVCVADDHAGVFGALLDAALERACTDGAAQLAAGFFYRDPLLAAARKRPHVVFRSHLYAVAWPEDGEPLETLDDRVPYLELGGL